MESARMEVVNLLTSLRDHFNRRTAMLHEGIAIKPLQLKAAPEVKQGGKVLGKRTYKTISRRQALLVMKRPKTQSLKSKA